MGCAGEREKIENKILLMKLEILEIQLQKEKELKKLSDIEGHEIKGSHIPDYIDPKFAREKQIYDDDDDEEIGYKKTNNSRKRDKSDKKKDNKVHHVLAELAVRVLAAAVLERELDLAAVRKEAAYLAQLVVEVVRVGAGMELDLLHLLHLLGLARLLGPNGLLVLELAVVHDLADRGDCIRGDLDEIETPLLGKALRLARRHDAEHAS